jgi:AraC-like DNA-binding protein
VTRARSSVELRVERGELPAAKRAHDDAAILFPLTTSVVSLELGGGREERRDERLDRASFAIVPPAARYRVRAKGATTTLVTVVLSAGLRATAAREYRPYIDPARFVSLLETARVLPRTRWVDELVHRYVFERDRCARHASRASQFLETELAKEVYFLCRDRDEQRTRASVVREEGDLVTRARALLDENLTHPVSMRELASACHASESTLLRAFTRELGTTPGAYARERRLDASLLLIQAGRYSVGEVAERSGYATLAAFTSAFRKRFGIPPSATKKTDTALELVLPEGDRARRKRRSL